MVQLTSFFGSLNLLKKSGPSILLWSLTFLQLPASSHHHVPAGGRTGAKSKYPRQGGAVVSFQLQVYSIKPVTYCQKAPLIANPKNTQSTMTFQLPLSSSRYDCRLPVRYILVHIYALEKRRLSSIRHCCPAGHVDVNATFAESSLIRGSFCLGCYRADAAAQPDAPASNHPPVLSRVSNFGSAGKEWEGEALRPTFPLPSKEAGILQDQIQRDEKTDTLQRALQLHSASQIRTPDFSPLSTACPLPATYSWL